MAEAKIFEIRDRCTFFPVLCVRLVPANEGERYLASRVGYGRFPEQQKDFVLMSPLAAGEKMEYDPFAWGSNPRTRLVAHEFITKNWETLTTGQVIDVEYILKEAPGPKVSESAEV